MTLSLMERVGQGRSLAACAAVGLFGKKFPLLARFTWLHTALDRYWMGQGCTH